MTCDPPAVNRGTQVCIFQIRYYKRSILRRSGPGKYNLGSAMQVSEH